MVDEDAAAPDLAFAVAQVGLLPLRPWRPAADAGPALSPTATNGTTAARTRPVRRARVVTTAHLLLRRGVSGRSVCTLCAELRFDSPHQSDVADGIAQVGAGVRASHGQRAAGGGCRRAAATRSSRPLTGRAAPRPVDASRLPPPASPLTSPPLLLPPRPPTAARVARLPMTATYVYWCWWPLPLVKLQLHFSPGVRGSASLWTTYVVPLVAVATWL